MSLLLTFFTPHKYILFLCRLAIHSNEYTVPLANVWILFYDKVLIINKNVMKKKPDN